MAFAYSIQLDFVDDKNKTSFTRVRVPTGFTIAQYTTFAQELAQAATDISGCSVTGASFTVAFTLTGLAAAAAAAADVASKAFFKVKSVVAGFFAKFQIPTFNEDVFVQTGTDDIDTADTAIAEFIAALEDGNGTVIPCDKYGNALDVTDISRELFTAHT